MQKSIWLEDIMLPEFPALEGECRTDVAIIGGGLTGLLCAWELKGRGIDCVVLEANRIFRGTSGRTTAKLTSQHGLIYGKLLKQLGRERAKLYWQANEEALTHMKRLCSTVDCDFHEERNYIYSRNSREVLDRELDALVDLDIPVQLVTELPLPFPTVGAVCFSGQGRFHPGKLAAALAPELRIYERSAVRGIRENQLFTDRGQVAASKIVVATHFPFLDPCGGYFLKLYQQRSYVLALENAGTVPGMFLDQSGDGLSLRMQGDLLLLGGGGHRTGKRGGGWECLEAAAKVWYPGSSIAYRWAAQDCMSLDGMPYIGQYSRSMAHVYVATGYNKWGMTAAMLAAQLLADLVQGRDNAYASLFSPSRPVNRNVLANAGHSALHLLKPTVPRCSHLGCALEWNRQERAWECPCHGSRYDEAGTVLEGPAQKKIAGKRRS